MSGNKQKKKLNREVILWTLIGIISAAIFAFCIYCYVVVIPAKREADRLALEEQRKQQELELSLAPTATTVPTSKPTETPVLTEQPTPTEPAVTVEPTKEPTVIPTATTAPTVTEAPVITEEPRETAAPTETPIITEEPLPSASPIPTVISTPIPTAISTPLPTATPAPTTIETDKADFVIQMGFNVYYKYYEDGKLLIVTGIGDTWDFETWNERWNTLKNYSHYDYPETIIIEEGITKIGAYSLGAMRNVKKVVMPDTLKEIGEYGFAYAGEYQNDTEWINLNLLEIKAEINSFMEANGVRKLEGGASVMATPTPTPTPVPPTPTPVPDANNPRLVYSKKMGDNITFEFWDNGYLYVKGTGKTDDMKGSYHWKIKEDAIFPIGSLSGEFLSTIKHLVVEEGVTYLGRNVFADIRTLETAQLPASLVEIDGTEGAPYVEKIHGYYNGKEFITTSSSGLATLYKFFDNEEMLKKYGISIEWK